MFAAVKYLLTESGRGQVDSHQSLSASYIARPYLRLKLLFDVLRCQSGLHQPIRLFLSDYIVPLRNNFSSRDSCPVRMELGGIDFWPQTRLSQGFVTGIGLINNVRRIGWTLNHVCYQARQSRHLSPNLESRINLGLT
jgi:hypothetical protein